MLFATNWQHNNSCTALCPSLYHTHKMVNVFWAPVVKGSSGSSWWGGQEARLKTMVKQMWWEPWPQEPVEAGIRPKGKASPGGGITYDIIAPICRQGNWGSERVSILLKVTLLGSGPSHFSCTSVKMWRSLHYSLHHSLSLSMLSPIFTHNHHLIHSLGSKSLFIRYIICWAKYRFPVSTSSLSTL